MLKGSQQRFALANLALLTLLLAACSGNSISDQPTGTASVPAEVSPTVKPAIAATPTESPEQAAQVEGISIFDANTFPEKYREIAKNWLTATNAQWAEYQRFVVAARAKFFQEQGISDEVSAIKDINPKLQSLWGMIYWVQHNRDQVIAGEIMPVVTPAELRIILEHEPTFLTRDRRENGIHVDYGVWQIGWGGHDYNSQNYGPILGRKNIVVPGRNPVDNVGGDLALMAREFPDDPSTLVTILNMTTPPEESFPYTHALYVQVAVFEENYTLPAGTMCFAGIVGETVHARPLPQDVLFGPPSHMSGQNILVNEQTFLDSLGANVLFGHDKPVGTSSVTIFSCTHPETGMELVTTVQDRTGNGQYPYDISPVAWPWQEEQVAPTATP